MSAPNNSNPTRAPNVAEKRLAETIDNIYSGNPQQHAFGKDGVAITEDAKNIRKEFDDFNKNATGVEKKQTPQPKAISASVKVPTLLEVPRIKVQIRRVRRVQGVV
ncbi:hypothetical protein HRS9122_03341 [Pyrenophora teres f. teres]|nr:hypothetical protein HRS9122_03341 [Pyrenophora teres f. teres]